LEPIEVGGEEGRPPPSPSGPTAQEFFPPKPGLPHEPLPLISLEGFLRLRAVLPREQVVRISGRFEK
jgi:hypothetical protein